jgi:methionyl aminopeptidase
LTVSSDEELAALRRAGRVAAEAIAATRSLVRPGVTTRELDDVARAVFDEYGARSAPNFFYGFPGTLCISVNDEAVHGIPVDRAIRSGDVVKLDATPVLDGYVADTAVTVVVEGDDTAQRLRDAAERALERAIRRTRAGRKARDVGRVVEREVRSRGFRVLREVGGHGLGRHIHEEPHMPNWDDPRSRDVLHEGLVIAIEPIIATGSERLITDADGWTLRTSDGSLAAHAEHTVVVTRGAPFVLTAA